MAKTEWSQRTVYEVQVRLKDRKIHNDPWEPTVNIQEARFTSRKKAEAGVKEADRRHGLLMYRVKVVSTRG